MEVPYKTKNTTTIRSRSPTTGHITRENRNSKRCMPSSVHCSTIYNSQETWKQPKCPLTDEWIKRKWYIYTMGYYSAIKKNEAMPFTARRMDLEIIILSKVSQTEKGKYHMTWFRGGV